MKFLGLPMMVAFWLGFFLSISNAAIHGGQPPVVPTVTPGSGWSGAIAQPAQVGGNSDNVIADWDNVPYQLFTGSAKACVIAFHNQGIASVTIGADNGTMVAANLTSVSNSGYPEYCAAIGGAGWSDGQHELRAVACPVAGVCRVLQSTSTVTANTTTTFTQTAHGQYTGKEFTTSGGSCAGLTDGTPYFIIATGLTNNTYEISTTSGGGAITASGSCSFTITYLKAGFADTRVTMGESLFIDTNVNGTIPFLSAYVDTATGSDAAACTSGAPCLTIYHALSKFTVANSGQAQTVGSASSCITFTRTGNNFPVNSGVIYTTSGTVDAPLVANDLYYVVGTTSNATTISATPGGACINASGGSGTRTLNSDVGNDTVYMMCSSPCSAPAQYAWGPASATSVYQAQNGYLNVGPAPGTLASNTVVICSGSTNGLRTTKVHFTGSLAATGSPTCGSGLAAQLVMNTASTWLDGVTGIGIGPTNTTGSPVSAGTGSNIYFTNNHFSFYQGQANGAMLSRNDVVDSFTGTGWNNVLEIVGSTATNVGIYQNVPLTTSADSPSGQNVITFPANTLPSPITIGWIVYGNANIPGGATITAFNQSAGTVTMSANLTGDIPTSSLLAIGTGAHPDLQFNSNSSGVGLGNQILYGSTGLTNVWAEGYFTQGGPIFDVAVVGNNIQVSNVNGNSGFQSLLLEGTTTNSLFKGNTWGGGINFTTGSPTFTSVYFQGETCTVPGEITSALKSGMTLTGGNC